MYKSPVAQQNWEVDMQNLSLAVVGNFLFVCAFFALMGGLTGDLIVEAFFENLAYKKTSKTKWSQEIKTKVILGVLIFVLDFWFYIDYKHTLLSAIHYGLLLNIGLSHVVIISCCFAKIIHTHFAERKRHRLHRWGD